LPGRNGYRRSVILAHAAIFYLPLGLCLLGFSFGPIYPITISFLSSRVPAHILPGAIGFLASLGSVGAAVFPWIAGLLAQRVGLWSLMPLVIVLAIAMFCLWRLLQIHPSIVEAS
jgi:fucose permease